MTLARRAFLIAAAALAGLFLLLWLATIPPALPSHARVKGGWKPSESWLHDRHGALLDSQRVNFATRRLAWVPLDQIASTLPAAVVAAEDKRFHDHGGIDWLALVSAVRARLEGKRSRGASTLSMQVAGFLDPELAAPGARGWLEKLRQMRAARSLESRWTKDQILETYLNLAGFRGEAQGIGAAALALFGKSPATLSPDESRLIAALLPDPNAMPGSVAKRACRATPARCALLHSLAANALGGPRAVSLDPGLAPHLAGKLLTEPGIRLETTIDLPTQRLAVAALRRQLSSLGSERARDGAVVVVDNESGDVLAYVGGIGGGSTAQAVDGADAYRQAGSTLKPFLYAMVMERGYLTPASILDDSPVQLDTASGLYVPQNYDRAFKGPVSVRTALAASLNVPAVRALVIAGPEPFRDRLWDAGYRGLTEDGQYYGFSLALGSAEVTLLEQVAAYRSLALGGLWSPLRLRASDPRIAPRRVFSPEAAWLVGSILSDPQARSSTFGTDSALRLPFWAAVKTGTSKAMRDNWCVGWSDRFTVAVWVGNLEGDSMKAVSGTSGAAPVWRDIMLALHNDQPGRSPPPPPGIESRRIAFAGAMESPRIEYFLRNTAQSVQTMAPAAARRPRIANPLSGSVYALDPDIPLDRQRLALSVTGEAVGHRLKLDERDLGDASARPMILAGPGTHTLALIDPSGKVVDRARFTVR